MVLPVELSLVPDCVSSYEDVCNALRHAVHLCELLAMNNLRAKEEPKRC